MAIHSSIKGLVVLLVVVIVVSSSSFEASATTFNVGGKSGWVVNPQEDYNHWSQRNTFRVNDYLYFKFERGKDSVLIVSKEDYDSCNTEKPLHRFRGGRSGSTIPLNRSGPFYFVSGNQQNCKQGQKFVVQVSAAVLPPTQPPSSTPSKPPQASPWIASPVHSPGLAPAPAPAPAGNAASSRSFGVALGIISFVVALLI
ncbi:hypothetical protein HN51_043545 [Arachis hypogaea]|uniref:Phytocyanin domain-containing protein n=1 Tax=Arachis hypogaea TaxID=3818 RepID=A0A444Y689_ARAHY|nr:early nodulin-like protein 2 [Arachis ipaensis]XP_025672379.1 early nodulin-like protein 2 [Arachis hypogaea]QHN95600.1 Early nodulin-like protein [Arachis hypogaea]QHN95601.1 Early nodulin-like protein [Arachis hypogaea]RYQ97422.1 hypothetical protein Ahy_B08g093466 isoform A [Arachis hypogaea]RYQ97423.1 hypothetical protein Ahy_B08g093466 isoform B [Arachis hypogaea]